MNKAMDGQQEIKLTPEDEQALKNLKETLEKNLDASNLKQQLEEEIKKDLETMWEPELKAECMRLISNVAPDQVNMDEVTNKLLEFGRAKIPESVKNKAYEKIKQQLENDPAYKDFIKA